MAVATSLTEKQVKTWFMNARTRRRGDANARKRRIPDAESNSSSKAQSADGEDTPVGVEHTFASKSMSLANLCLRSPEPPHQSDIVQLTEHIATNENLAAANVLVATLTVSLHPPASGPPSCPRLQV